jgi:FHA domain-containing protein
MVQVALSADFLVAYSNIPKRAQKKAREFTKKFLADPRQASINYESINAMKDPKVRTVRIGLDYRAIVLHPPKGDVYVCVWVDHHDEAMAWAKNKRFEINPQVGSFQVFEVHESEEPPDDTLDATRDPLPHGRLLAGRTPHDLLRAGVPELLLPSVLRLEDDAQLDALRSYLPNGVAEALTMLAAGYELGELLAERAASVDTDDLEAALRHPDSQRRFKVLDNEGHLDALLTEPLEATHTFAEPSADPEFIDISPRAQHAVIVRVVGTDGERTLSPGERWTIGRQADCDLVLDDARVSRRQFEVENLGDRLRVLALPSKNATHVVGRRAGPDIYFSKPAVTVRVAETAIVLRRPD